MPYIGRSTDGFGVRNRFLYLASADDTSVSGADANGATLTFTDGAYVDVYLNGVLLKAGTDYNTNTANTIASLSAMAANDEVTVIVYDVFTVGDMVSATSGGTFVGNVAMGGTLGVTGATTTAAITASGVVDITNTTDASDDSGDTGALRVEGGASIAKKLYVGTDLDVDGTANLDVVDIDGAVDMASTLTVAGAFTSPGIDDNGDATTITIDANEDITAANGMYVSGDLTSLTVDKGGIDRSGSTTRIISARAGGNYADFSVNIAGVDASDGNNGLNRQLYIDYQGNTTLDNGNLVIGTSGKGISFAATADGSGANQAEVFDDYEEGTWTPTLPNGGSVSVSNARYTKTGQMVYVGCYITITSVPNDSAMFQIGGLPFTVAGSNAYHAAGCVQYTGSFDWNSTGSLGGITAYYGNAILYFHRGDGNNAAIINNAVDGTQPSGLQYFIFGTTYVSA